MGLSVRGKKRRSVILIANLVAFVPLILLFLGIIDLGSQVVQLYSKGRALMGMVAIYLSGIAVLVAGLFIHNQFATKAKRNMIGTAFLQVMSYLGVAFAVFEAVKFLVVIRPILRNENIALADGVTLFRLDLGVAAVGFSTAVICRVLLARHRRT